MSSPCEIKSYGLQRIYTGVNLIARWLLCGSFGGSLCGLHLFGLFPTTSLMLDNMVHCLQDKKPESYQTHHRSNFDCAVGVLVQGQGGAYEEEEGGKSAGYHVGEVTDNQQGEALENAG